MSTHSLLTGDDLHEPKGVEAANADQVYVSNGEGSGSWTDVSDLDVDAFSGNEGGANEVFVSNGTEGGSWSSITEELIDSEEATENQTLFADGSGGAYFGSIEDKIFPLVETLIDSQSVATSQNPTTTDTPLQIEFGAAVNDSSDKVMLSAAGALTINEDGYYLLNVNLEVGRTGGQGESQIYVRALRNGTQTGTGFYAKLDDSDVTVPYNRYRWLYLEAGDVITWEIMRDSSGNNSGGLQMASPTLASWSDVPTSRLIVQTITLTS